MMVDKLFDEDYSREANYAFFKQKNGRYIIKCNKVGVTYRNCQDYIIDLTFYQKHDFTKHYQYVSDNTPYINNTNIMYAWPYATMKKAILTTKVNDQVQTTYKDMPIN